MDESVANALGVFLLVAVGVLAAGYVMGQLATALLVGPAVGVTFGAATYVLFSRS
jgi:hypothetical protein